MEGLVKEIDEEHGRMVTDANAKVAITTDCWSSQNLSCSLLGITAHVLSPNFVDRENIRLYCIPLDGNSQRATCSMYIAVGQTLIKKTERNCASARREAKMFGEALLAKATSYFKPWSDDKRPLHVILDSLSLKLF
ncbi:hypothetical protein Y032_0771g2221 [Ancylostoma ceylanicum]|nr:hypothetical protein Y032_0771g2221 [Ancylostoma ceylanicum]